MEKKFDLIIRDGTIHDGKGGEPLVADIAIAGGLIKEVGRISGSAREEIDARGLIVTPGFVDIHTHYDANATWDNRLQPSSSHGVTTVVMGNCGVGFAPCRPQDHDKLIELMEGVEDIPGVALTEGLPWTWETFPQYLDFLATRQFDMDVGAQLPHAPLRVYVMGQRGVDRENATPDDIAQMTQIANEAIASGALGFSTSRSINHKSVDGKPIASQRAAEDELTAIALTLRDQHKGVLQVISDFDDAEREFGLIRRLAEKSGRPLSFSLLQLPGATSNRWKTLLDWVNDANAKGIEIRGQVCGRPIGVLLGYELSYCPFTYGPAYRAIHKLPFAERIKELNKPEVKARILAEFPAPTSEALGFAVTNFERIYELGEPGNYEPTPDQSLAARAAKLCITPQELAYDLMLKKNGQAILYAPAVNYAEGNINAAIAMVQHKNTVLGLGDGGAHCGLICDASFTTYMLTRWAKDARGRLPLPRAVKALTSETAAAVGLMDRGVIAAGYRADLNVIDFDRLAIEMPGMVYDLPSGKGRLKQSAQGYVATIVNGQVTYRNGEATGALPGRLVRGQQTAPNA